ncbi:MAG: hypothetical protein QOI20_2917 [Acidimicrobiaceae bacterium]|jgi:hypothetical protein|nr:hypothetical protein [Acidimicrobiaceae bacterium]
MERESAKHSGRLDDQMAHEVESMTRGNSPEESRSRADRVLEESTEDDVRTDLDARAELARHITAATWPAAKEELVHAARVERAPQEVLDSLRTLPEEARFENVQAVWAALGGPTEGAHTHGGG